MRFIGGKSKLLQDIEDILTPHLDGTEQSFMDIFAGTGVVSNYFKKDYRILSNDFMYFSGVLLHATIKNNDPLQFNGLKEIGIHNPLSYLQDSNKTLNGFITQNYSPAGEENRMYFTVHNAGRIDFIRTTIEEWYQGGQITENEYFYLLAVLVEAVPYVSNITGTYGAFLKHWDKRALNEIVLNPIEIVDNGKDNEVYIEDANELIKKVSGDILYIDPPYNTRQYVPNYHVLETIARYDQPTIKGVTGLRNYDDQKSAYSQKRNAFKALNDLISSADFKHIVLSYSTDGIIPEEDLISMLKGYDIHSEVDVVRIPYRKYKSKVVSKTDDTHELLFYIQKKTNQKNAKPVAVKKNKSSWSASGLIKSPLNYIGGKYKLLPQILPLFPGNIHTFVDLFSGGANVGINVDAKKHYFVDINVKLNELFEKIQELPIEAILKHIESRIEEYGLSKTNQEGYLKFRDDYNSQPTPLDLYVLVSFSYNYQLRFNNNHQFNNPFGKNRSSFSENMKRNLILFSERIKTKDAEFLSYEFNKFPYFDQLTENDFVYADPPYLITTGNYNDGNRGFKHWTPKEELELYQLLDSLNDRNVRFALSNVMNHKGKSNDSLKEWAKKYNVHHLNYNYSNSSYNTKKIASDEVLITNYEVEVKTSGSGKQ
jgi:adenine-specific DNA-methyltransferase